MIAGYKMVGGMPHTKAIWSCSWLRVNTRRPNCLFKSDKRPGKCFAATLPKKSCAVLELNPVRSIATCRSPPTSFIWNIDSFLMPHFDTLSTHLILNRNISSRWSYFQMIYSFVLSQTNLSNSYGTESHLNCTWEMSRLESEVAREALRC